MFPMEVNVHHPIEIDQQVTEKQRRYRHQAYHQRSGWSWPTGSCPAPKTVGRR
jgi:hypothetical protein